MIMITIGGYIAVFFTIYNIFCGMISRLAGNDDSARANDLEAAIWFIAATVAFK